ncbi:MAG: DsrE/DsrF/DrsH-like family protein, partial [bacterium]
MSEQKKMALIASQGTLDWAYPPFILASTAAAMDMEVQIFFTFYGLTLLKKDIKAKVAPATNPAMPMKMPFGPKGFQDFEWPMPNVLMGNMPGFETMATSLMKKTFKNKGVATIEELREMCVESGVKLIGCQMT